MGTNWGCNHTKMVILTSFFFLFKLDLNHVMGSASFSFNLKEKHAESIMVKQFSYPSRGEKLQRFYVL